MCTCLFSFALAERKLWPFIYAQHCLRALRTWQFAGSSSCSSSTNTRREHERTKQEDTRRYWTTASHHLASKDRIQQNSTSIDQRILKFRGSCLASSCLILPGCTIQSAELSGSPDQLWWSRYWRQRQTADLDVPWSSFNGLYRLDPVWSGLESTNLWQILMRQIASIFTSPHRWSCQDLGHFHLSWSCESEGSVQVRQLRQLRQRR